MMTPAERTIEHLLENNPDVLASIIKNWLRTDTDIDIGTGTNSDRT